MLSKCALPQANRLSATGALKAAMLAVAVSIAALPLPQTAAAQMLESTRTSTLGVECTRSFNVFNPDPRVNAQSISNWTCNDTARTLTGNGIPNHPTVGPNFATQISAQNINVSMPIDPVLLAMTPTRVNGYILNGIKMEPATNGSCQSTATSILPGGGCVAAMGTGPWVLEAIGGAFTFALDDSNAHVQPNGQYHYHGAPEVFISSLNLGTAMTLVGFAVDGFPIYARFGYSDALNASSPTRLLTPSYRLKAVPDAGRPSVTIFPMGTFTPDYEYAAGLGDLDECNGRFGVTPQFPGGIYHYYITNSFPYIQRCVKGSLTIVPPVLFASGFE